MLTLHYISDKNLAIFSDLSFIRLLKKFK